MRRLPLTRWQLPRHSQTWDFFLALIEATPIKTMITQFMSLEAFLLLKDPTDPHGRSAHREYRAAADYVVRYNLAKASWEAHGDAPPLGAVRWLDTGATFFLLGEFDRDRRFFALDRKDKDDRVSIALKEHWWLRFTTPEIYKQFMQE